MLHLKRFSNSRKKVNTLIDFPVANFDASPLAADDSPSSFNPIYDLYAICNHSGRLNGGHYTATCIDPHSGSWHMFNDECVLQKDTLPDLDRAGAYMLFYRLKESVK